MKTKLSSHTFTYQTQILTAEPDSLTELVIVKKEGSRNSAQTADSRADNVRSVEPNTEGRDQANDASVGRCPWQLLSRVVVVWRTHRGGLVPRVYTERSDRPWVVLNLCVMRRYNLGEGDLVSTSPPLFLRRATTSKTKGIDLG